MDSENIAQSPLPCSGYHYNAIVTEVYDGDTCTVNIDLGLHIWSNAQKLRLNRINAPELRGDEKDAGMQARDYLRSLILGKQVIIETIKDRTEKYGRYLVEILLPRDGDFMNVNDTMVANGFAEYFKT